MRILWVLIIFACHIRRGSPCLPREAFITSPVVRFFSQHVHNHGSLAARCRREPGPGRLANAKMVFGNMAEFSGLLGRMMLPQNDDLGMQRQELNRLHVERDNMVEKIKRKMRAASYNMGEQDWCHLFSSFDRDGNGMIDFEEFEKLCRQMGLHSSQMSTEEMNIVFEEVDSERRGSIEVTDFTKWLSGNLPGYGDFLVDPVKAVHPLKSESDPKSTVSIWTYGSAGMLTRPVPEEIRPAGNSFSNARLDVSSESLEQGEDVSDNRGRSSTLETLVRQIEPFVETSGEQLREVVYFLLIELGLSRHKVMGLAIAAPNIFLMNVEANLRPQVMYLQDIGVPVTRVGR
jgi:hypothetical protein